VESLLSPETRGEQLLPPPRALGPRPRREGREEGREGGRG
jgi:hypothetical protein